MNPIDPNALPTQSLEWGTIKWLVSPAHTEGAVMAFGEVVLLPGKGFKDLFDNKQKNDAYVSILANVIVSF